MTITYKEQRKNKNLFDCIPVWWDKEIIVEEKEEKKVYNRKIYKSKKVELL